MAAEIQLTWVYIVLEKLTLMNPVCGLKWCPLKLTQNPKLESSWLNSNKPWILAENKVLIKPKQVLGYS